MRLHDKGQKADRDRAVVLHSYKVMCREFRVPRRQRLTTVQILSMSNNQLYQASKDLYNGATVKQARRLARKLGLNGPVTPPIVRWFRKVAQAWRRTFVAA